MSHYHVGKFGLVDYHNNDMRCGGGSHTRYDYGFLHYVRVLEKLNSVINYPWKRFDIYPKKRSPYRHRRKGRS